MVRNYIKKGKPVKQLTHEDLEKDLTKEQKELLVDVRLGRRDPVFFAEKLLGIELHPGQKVWLWMTTRKELDKAFALGFTLHDEFRKTWKNREEFDALIERLPESQKNIL